MRDRNWLDVNGTHPFILTNGPDIVALGVSRIARLVVAGYPYHVLQRGNNRQAVFIDNVDKMKYLDLLSKYSQKWFCGVLAYCLMTNHVHLLLDVKNQTALAKLMQGVSLCYTQAFNRRYKRSGRLWECRYHSCLVNRDKYLLQVLRYIERNPVRAGMTASAEQYRWSSARAHLLGEDNPIITPGALEQWVDLKEYRDFARQILVPEELSQIRQATQQGKALGDKVFIRKLEHLTRRSLAIRPRGRPWPNQRTGNK